MADIFISYAHQDRESAKRIAEAIESRGWTVWWDRRIPAGKSFEDVIEREIDAASCIIVLWTRNSVAPEWVRNEAGEGASRKALIPIRLEAVRLPLAFRHLHADDLLDWTSSELETCLASIASMIGAPATRAPEPAAIDPLVTIVQEPARSEARAEDPIIVAIPMLDAPAALRPHVQRPSRRTVLISIIATLVIGGVFLWIVAQIPMKREELATETAATETSATHATETSGEMTFATMDTSTVTSTDPMGRLMTTTGLDPNVTSTAPLEIKTMMDVVDLHTTAGTITVELFPEDAPKHVTNFLDVARKGALDGAPVYFVTKGGIYAGRESTGAVPQERNGIAFMRGTIMGIALPDGADSATKLFITVKDAPQFDWEKNTVFGRVIEGMDVVDRIARAPTDSEDRPLSPITITRVVARKRTGV